MIEFRNEPLSNFHDPAVRDRMEEALAQVEGMLGQEVGLRIVQRAAVPRVVVCSHAKKPIDQLSEHALSDTGLKRVLGPWSLTAIGLGGIIGVGIFVLTGIAAATQAGPGVLLCFVIAGLASAAAALCYAEFAGMIPVAGSAYTYSYAVLGELLAWIIGWDLLLEYTLVVAVVAIGWSGYLSSVLHELGWTLPTWAQGAPGTGPGHVFDLLAALINLVIAGLLTIGIQWGSRFNSLLVGIKFDDGGGGSPKSPQGYSPGRDFLPGHCPGALYRHVPGVDRHCAFIQLEQPGSGGQGFL